MNRPRILLVEDNEDDAFFARRALDKTGVAHDLVVARDGDAAIAHARGDPLGFEPWAFVLLDLKLPGPDGKTVLRELRGSPLTSRVPIIVVTSSDEEQDVLDCFTLGANAYFRKPVDLDQFERGVAVLTTYWLNLNVPPGATPSGAGRHRYEVPASVADAAARIEGAGRSSWQSSPPAPTRVLVVDPDEASRRTTIETLKRIEGVERVEGFASFAAYASWLQDVGGPPPLLRTGFPTLLVIDPALPDGSGLDAIQASRYRTDHHLVIVVLTRALDAATVSECYRLKVNSVLHKPDDPARLAATARVLGHYWLRMGVRPPTPATIKRALAHPG